MRCSIKACLNSNTRFSIDLEYRSQTLYLKKFQYKSVIYCHNVTSGGFNIKKTKCLGDALAQKNINQERIIDNADNAYTLIKCTKKRGPGKSALTK